MEEPTTKSKKQKRSSQDTVVVKRAPKIPEQEHTPTDVPRVGIRVPVPVSSHNTTASLCTASTMSISSQNAESSMIQSCRMSLPVCGMEQEIVEAVHMHDVVVLCGETGSGKSTQIPQFLHEAGYSTLGRIAITQPRRVAAVSTCQRVSYEMGQTNIPISKRLIGYHIRHDKHSIGDATKIVFATDGILLKEATNDILLRQYSVVILDEAHERNINTDILIGILSRSVILRRRAYKEQQDLEHTNESDFKVSPLKLVIMSATLRVDDFLQLRLFTPIPPVIRVENRQYNVTVHFSKRTELVHYLDEVFNKICQIHKQLPDGGILVFLTGKREILYMCRRLNNALNKSSKIKSKYASMYAVGDENVDGDGGSDIDGDIRTRDDDEMMGDELDLNEYADVADEDVLDDQGEEDLLSLSSHSSSPPISKDATGVTAGMLRQALGFSTSAPHDDQDTKESKRKGADIPSRDFPSKPSKAFILPLFAVMGQAQQTLVFQPPPSGHRLIVIATNVAETSITIPGIKYVVDSGRQKERVFTPSGISKFEVCWISKASAEQRAGRSGRTGPGHCYRLYSSAFYDQHMEQFQEPEIVTTPLEDVLLQMRALGIHDVEAFPFPTPPPVNKLRQALKLLVHIGAVAVAQPGLKPKHVTSAARKNNNRIESNSGGALTQIGRLLAKFPLNPRLSKILVIAFQSGLLSFGLSLVAVLSEKSPFGGGKEETGGSATEGVMDEEDDDVEGGATRAKQKSMLSYHPESDALARLKAFGAFLHELSQGKAKAENLCMQYQLQYSGLERMSDLRHQLSQLSLQVLGGSRADAAVPGAPPTLAQEAGLRQALLSGFTDCVARKGPALTQGTRRRRLTAYYSCNSEVTEPLYVHPSSALYNSDPTAPTPEYLVYADLTLNAAATYTYMACVTAISPSWIASLAAGSPMLQFSAPLPYPQPFYDASADDILCYVVPYYGDAKWELPVVTRPIRECAREAEVDEANNSCLGYRKQDLKWLARLLLQGCVFPELRRLANGLKDPPAHLTQKTPSQRSVVLLSCLIRNKITNKSTLLDEIRRNRSYLSAELEPLYKTTSQVAFRQAWRAVCEKAVST